MYLLVRHKIQYLKIVYLEKTIKIVLYLYKYLWCIRLTLDYKNPIFIRSIESHGTISLDTRKRFDRENSVKQYFFPSRAALIRKIRYKERVISWRISTDEMGRAQKWSGSRRKIRWEWRVPACFQSLRGNCPTICSKLAHRNDNRKKLGLMSLDYKRGELPLNYNI